MEFYVFKEGKQKGPFTEDEIAEMVELSVLSQSDLLWQDGMPDWEPLSKVLVNHESLEQVGRKAQVTKSPQTEQDMDLAPLDKRATAKVIDIFLLAIASSPFLLILWGDRSLGIWSGMIFWAVMVAIQMVLISSSGQSIGKKVAGIKVVKVIDGGAVNGMNALFLRMTVASIFYCIPAMGWLLIIASGVMIFMPARRCVHDYLAGTKVVALAELKDS